MSTVRRLYFYGLVLISVEVIVWGVINLLRTVATRGLAGGDSTLATGLSLVLVGIPIFWLHWRTVQRDAQREPEEHASRIRAVFLYAVLFSTLLPIIYAILALLDRGFTTLLGQPASSAWFGGDGTALDNLIAIVINGAALAYFLFILRKDWLSDVAENYLADARRFYRYLWILFGLIMMIAGVYNLLNYVLSFAGQDAQGMASNLAAGVSLALVGVPVWGFHWWSVQAALVDPVERRSLLRLVVLYLISLAGVIGVVAAAARVLSGLIQWMLGAPGNFVSFLQESSEPLAIAVPLAVMWWYYGQILTVEVAAMPDQPRREALNRLYNYILSLLGLAVTFAGLINLVEFLARLVITRVVFASLRSTFSGALAALIVGLPLWLVTWRMMQREASRRDDAGDHARRSVLRKAYLYLVLFLLVIGAMSFSGWLLYTLTNTLLAGDSGDFGIQVTRTFLSLVIDGVLLIYHWRALREDGRLAQQTVGDLHAAFPTLVLLEEDGGFGDLLVQNLQRIAPMLPVALHMVERGAPDETMLGAKAVLLPMTLAIKPPESLQLWLAEYQGRRIVVPLPSENWYWLGQSEKQVPDLARETAQALRQIAEGQAVRQAPAGGPWAIAGYILGGIFGLILLMFVFSIMVSSLFQ